MNINDFAHDVYDNCVAHGFHEEASESERETIGIMVANLHSEVSELWEAYREGRLHCPCNKATKMKELGVVKELTCAEEKLADIIIRALDDLLMFGSDPEEVLLAKHRYNKQRPMKHGKLA